jgi:zona occludens toxin (predicted ATPase)
MRNLEALKIRGVQREKKKKKSILRVGKFLFLLAIVSSLIFIYNSKMISKALGSTPITFQITQNEAHMMRI